jgi:hypothetical protein
MSVSDLDISRSAHLWIRQHGDQALAKAREMVEGMRRKGDEEGADTWLRILAAITTLGRLRSFVQHFTKLVGEEAREDRLLQRGGHLLTDLVVVDVRPAS